jgi:hypothetical protein
MSTRGSTYRVSFLRLRALGSAHPGSSSCRAPSNPRTRKGESSVRKYHRRDFSAGRVRDRTRRAIGCLRLAEFEEIVVVVMNRRNPVAERNQRFHSDSRLRVTAVSHNSPSIMIGDSEPRYTPVTCANSMWAGGEHTSTASCAVYRSSCADSWFGCRNESGRCWKLRCRLWRDVGWECSCVKRYCGFL